ncbi:hypothetical protein M0R04_10070 [Candidatus Dojkabacteria bacterium]|jgi:hypothetical protein|nr:hypothetical protein [Candidatus Dojkabacteria bacterium]
MKEEIQYEDLKTLLLGEVLGIGIHRKVGVYKQDESLVIKCAVETPNINILEDEIWMMVKDTSIAKWFAPCVAISECGMFLLQKRIEKIPKEQYPKFIPSFFGDLKYRNFGMLNGQFVCCDYAGFISSSMSHKWSGKLKKAEWWD